MFPELVGRGLYGSRLDGYWVDIGTPDRFLQANWDILEREVETVIADRLDPDGCWSRRRRGQRRGHGRGAGADRGGARGRGRGQGRPQGRARARLRGRGARECRGLGAVRRLPGGRGGERPRIRSSRPRSRSPPRPRSSRLGARRGRPCGGCRMSDMREAVMAMPDHLRDALWRIESARLRTMEAPAVIVCGMGGSAIGGDLAAAALGDRLSRPMFTMRGYELPAWAPAGSAVLCSSYSGETEETLACYEAAEALGAQRLVATTGGELAEWARRDGVPVIGLPPGSSRGPRSPTCSATPPSSRRWRWGRRGSIPRSTRPRRAEDAEGSRGSAERVAGQLGDATVVIYGSDLTAPVAYRWKAQLNENAKAPAFARCCRRPTTTSSRAGPGRRPRRFARLSRGPRPAPPRSPALRPDRRVDRAACPRRGPARDRGGEPDRAPDRAVMLGDLVSLDVAERRGRTRRRSR